MEEIHTEAIESLALNPKVSYTCFYKAVEVLNSYLKRGQSKINATNCSKILSMSHNLITEVKEQAVRESLQGK